MDIIRIDRLTVTPWKNGGGTSRTLAVSPSDAAIDREDWRVALSDIDRPGPFSYYPGFDRLLLPLASGLRLGFAGVTPAPVAGFEAIAFDGATPTLCDLAADAAPAGVQVVNLLLRRGRFAGRLRSHGGPGRLQAGVGAIVLLAVRGGFQLVLGGERPVALDAGHAALQEAGGVTLAFEPYRPWSVLVSAEIRPA